jgi:hypothetical protein
VAPHTLKAELRQMPHELFGFLCKHLPDVYHAARALLSGDKIAGPWIQLWESTDGGKLIPLEEMEHHAPYPTINERGDVVPASAGLDNFDVEFVASGPKGKKITAAGTRPKIKSNSRRPEMMDREKQDPDSSYRHIKRRPDDKKNAIKRLPTTGGLMAIVLRASDVLGARTILGTEGITGVVLGTGPAEALFDMISEPRYILSGSPSFKGLAGGITLIGGVDNSGSTGGWPYCSEVPQLIKLLQTVVPGEGYEAHLAPGQTSKRLEEALTPLITPGVYGPRTRQTAGTVEEWEQHNNVDQGVWSMPVTALAAPEDDESWVVPTPMPGMAEAVRKLRLLARLKVGVSNALIAHATFAIPAKAKRALLECVGDRPLGLVNVEEPREITVPRKTVSNTTPDSAKMRGISAPALFIGRVASELKVKNKIKDGPLNRSQLAFGVLALNITVHKCRESAIYISEEEAVTVPEMLDGTGLHYNVRAFLTDAHVIHTDFVEVIWGESYVLEPIVQFWKEFNEGTPGEEEMRESFRANMGYISAEGGDDREAARISAEFISRQHMQRCINKTGAYVHAKKNQFLFEENPWQLWEDRYIRLTADLIQLTFFNLMWALSMLDGINCTLNPAYKLMIATGLIADNLAVRDDYDDEDTLSGEEFREQVKMAPAFAPPAPTQLTQGRKTEIRESGAQFMIDRVDLLGLLTSGARAFRGREYVDAYLAGVKGLSAYAPPKRDDPDPGKDSECTRIVAARDFCQAYNTTSWSEAARIEQLPETASQWVYGTVVPRDEKTLLDISEWEDTAFKEAAAAMGQARAVQLTPGLEERDNSVIFIRKLNAPGRICQPLAWQEFIEKGRQEMVAVEMGQQHREDAQQFFVKINQGVTYQMMREFLEGTTPDRATPSGVDLGGDVSDDGTHSARSNEEA